MFRTQTGQTGKDAYRYEAAAIANELRELQARWDALRETISNEAPEANVTSEVYVPSTGERSQDTRALADVLRGLPLADVKRAGELISRADYTPAQAPAQRRYVPVYVAGNATIHAGRKVGQYASGVDRYRKLCSSSARDNHTPMPISDPDFPITCKRCLAKVAKAEA